MRVLVSEITVLLPFFLKLWLPHAVQNASAQLVLVARAQTTCGFKREGIGGTSLNLSATITLPLQNRILPAIATDFLIELRFRIFAAFPPAPCSGAALR